MKPINFCVAFAFCSILIAPAEAQEWPAGPVTMVVPSSAGGGADIFGRIFAARLSEILGKPVIIENIGNGVTAVSRVAKVAPDGYHFGLGTAGTFAFSQSLYKNPLFNAVTDFAPVALIAEQPLVLVTGKAFPASSVREFAAYAKMNQAKMQFGSGAGIGSSNHIVCELLNSAIGIKVTHVPYRDIGPATQDMIAGRIDYLCPLAGAMIPLIQSDQIKGIAVLGKERLRNLPNLATAAEQGLTDFDGSTWFAFFLPKGTRADHSKAQRGDD
jgi:tripartite-type tricarboxylate transporter receptor subunit TctC